MAVWEGSDVSAKPGLTNVKQISFQQDFSGPLAGSHLACFSDVCGDIQHLPNALGYGMLLLPTEFLQPCLGNENKLIFWLFVWVQHGT